MPNPLTSNQGRDANGHLIDDKGSLIFDPECRGCDAPKPSIPERCKHDVHGTDCFECYPTPLPSNHGTHGEECKNCKGLENGSVILLDDEGKCQKCGRDVLKRSTPVSDSGDLKKSKWIVLEDTDCIHVVPETDLKPHGFQKDGKADLADMNCPCRPRVDMRGRKPLIIHNSFDDMEKINNSIDTSFSTKTLDGDWEKEFDDVFVVNHNEEEHPIVAFYNEEENKLEYWNAYKVKKFIASKLALESKKREEALEAYKDKVVEYLRWLNDKNRGQATVAHVHGFINSQEDIIEGIKKRKDLGIDESRLSKL